jgi:sugar phosphate isomerase/epimerase
MRFGGPVFRKFTNPEEWVAAVREKGFTAAYCPVELDADARTIEDYRGAAQKAGIVIAEVGAWWVNPLSPDATKAKEAMKKCTRALEVADAIDARCCVNVSGSKGEKWDGPSALDLTEQTFDDIVSAVRAIVDSVKPTRAFYALEPMPWMYPDSTESYVKLLRAVDRKAFAVHFDPVNMINCPSRYFQNGAFIRDFFRALGPHIKSCHAKDIILGQQLTVHLDERIPGQGTLDYAVYLDCLNALEDKDVCLMTEHLDNEKDYDAAAAAIRSVARRQGITI